MTTAQAETDHSRHLLREMLRIRRFEEKCAELYSAGKIRGFLHLYIGEEAVAVGVMQARCRRRSSLPRIASTGMRWLAVSGRMH
jgi:TPP-dependent pyruvate/acetoin dehydrogenase alpha subunit